MGGVAAGRWDWAGRVRRRKVCGLVCVCVVVRTFSCRKAPLRRSWSHLRPCMAFGGTALRGWRLPWADSGNAPTVTKGIRVRETCRSRDTPSMSPNASHAAADIGRHRKWMPFTLGDEHAGSSHPNGTTQGLALRARTIHGLRRRLAATSQWLKDLGGVRRNGWGSARSRFLERRL